MGLMDQLTPRELVEALDRYIIGQDEAKRAVAVAIRNRWRRRQLEPTLAREVTPKNIIMVGPTGVGKTEIARRLAQLTHAPFVKVEASKFTEVGYHGRDVESMIRDLVDRALSLVREEAADAVSEQAESAALDRLVEILMPEPASPPEGSGGGYVPPEGSEQRRQEARRRMREQIAAGKLDDREVEIEQKSKPSSQGMLSQMGLEQMEPDMSQLFDRFMPEQSQTKRVTVSEAKRILREQETEKLLDDQKLRDDAVERVQETGIVFLDELDKIAGGGAGEGRGPDVSREGVQRDLLPIVEGATVNTRHGAVRTDHILFVAAGAFHGSSVSDLMPELQGRFPVRVELASLTRDDFVRVLREPDNALLRQHAALFGAEGLELELDDAAIERIADYAAQANASMENIGARRLMTVLERLFEQLNFDAPERIERGDTRFRVTADYVEQQVGPTLRDEDLSKFIL